ncbi:hypothetical protein HPB48_009754 [Haemaphysalis longicornis]|uniref:Uncharacterized protein n=1 Tax=Haemaphysalis longicornis TaxID=44386 RepID=A0A9J6GEI1_HAELO|nr:hypothetical protein HPB48_009754 [Haemaphysalis longicornis]
MECHLAHSKQAIKAACILHNVCESLKDTVEQRWESEARALDALYAQPTRTTQEASQRGHHVLLTQLKLPIPAHASAAVRRESELKRCLVQGPAFSLQLVNA